MWVDANGCIPFTNGVYLVQTVFGEVSPLDYTHKGGWNTHYDDNGNLHEDNALPYLYVARWYKVSTPPAVPKEWKEKYLYRKEN